MKNLTLAPHVAELRIGHVFISRGASWEMPIFGNSIAPFLPRISELLIGGSEQMPSLV